MLPIVTYLVSMLALISTVYSTPAVVDNSLSLHNTSFLAAYDDSKYILEWICDHDTSPAHQNSIRDGIDTYVRCQRYSDHGRRKRLWSRKLLLEKRKYMV
ncbi:Putative protein of unknown function [Podospora comata]|uniref:Uncharacterized protein n=1 Tax=Podospora comata TaxID=48703 RepID=A0ABY6S3R9_PODCO|nr:Putative protein of unknown function [Podospora comata]